MNYMNMIYFLASFNNLIIETNKRPNMVKHRCIFVLLLCIEVLIKIVDINALGLDNMNLLKIISYSF